MTTETSQEPRALSPAQFEAAMSTDLPLRPPAVCELLGLAYNPNSLRQFAARCKDFPVPVQAGEHGHLFWWRSEIMAWLRAQPRSTAKRWQGGI